MYSFCDGITHGMGADQIESIPTVFYPFLAKQLGLKYIITEQNISGFRKSNYEIDQIKKWIDNIIKLRNNLQLKKLRELDGELFLKILYQSLESINEYQVNENGKMRFFGHHIHHDLVIKEMHDDIIKKLKV